MKFTIALCTRNRPQMLTACINSIKSLIVPSDCQLHLVIVENDEKPKCETLVKELMKSTPDLDYTYIFERKLGIPIARNTSLEVAIQTDPDWICFIDDDETVNSDWLVKYYEIIKTESADVYTGPVEHILPENLPVWFKFPKPYRFENLEEMDTAATNNTIAKSSYFNGQQHAFRFQEKFRFTGGEDTDLFSRIKVSGGLIRYAREAMVCEVVAEERIRIKWMLEKQFSNGNLAMRGHISAFGQLESNRYWKATKHFIREFWKQSSSGILFFLWGLLIWPFSKRAIRYIVKGLAKLCWVFGVFSGLIRINFNLYKEVEGN